MSRFARRCLERLSRLADDSGQYMVVFIMFMAIILGFAGLVVDTADYMMNKSKVQHAVDAAALAAAQDLPADNATAQNTALSYMTANAPDIPSGNISTSFRCIVGDRDNNNSPDSSDIPAACDPGGSASWTCQDGLCYSLCDPNISGNKCNTIVVSASKQVPFYFTPALKLLTGGNSCVYDECSTGTIKAAACRGACGLSSSAPLDVMMVIDRTSSLSDTELAQVKTGANSVLSLYDPNYQQIGFSVLGPSLTGDLCNSVSYDVTRANMVWRPVGLSTDYKNNDGTVNTSSSLYSTLNCLTHSSVRTNLGEGLRAAKNELINNGRAGVSKGIIFFTDGEANRWDSNDTGWKTCSANAAITSSAGDNNGFETSAGNGCAKDGSVATDTNSGTSTTNSCTASNKDKHRYYNYALGVPSSAKITGIEVEVTARADSSSSSPRMCVELSWNGGTSYTSTGNYMSLGSSLSTDTFGAPYDDWGRTWSDTDFSDSNFRVRITNTSTSSSRDFYLDAVRVRVFYNDAQTASLGPCDYLVTEAAAAKAAGIEVFTIGYGLSGLTCGDDRASSPYYGSYATTVLAATATTSSDDHNHCSLSTDQTSENADGDHFYCNADASNLTSLFTAAATSLLGSGSKLMNVPF